MELTWEKAKELGKKFFEELPDEEFLKIKIIGVCSRCGKEYIITPCKLMPRDHGHQSGDCQCPSAWISGANGCPFRG